MNTNQLYPYWTPAGRHLNEACANGSFPKTLLYVNGMVIVSFNCFIVFKVDALSRGSVMIQHQHMTNHYGAIQECWKLLEGSSLPKNLIPMQVHKLYLFLHSNSNTYCWSAVARQTMPQRDCLQTMKACHHWWADNALVNDALAITPYGWPITLLTNSVDNVWSLRGSIDLAFEHVE